MRRLSCLAALVWIVGAGAALAERPLTLEEKEKLVGAMLAVDCVGGDPEFDDDEYEVEDVKCADGGTYDLTFDKTFRLVKKERAD